MADRRNEERLLSSSRILKSAGLAIIGALTAFSVLMAAHAVEQGAQDWQQFIFEPNGKRVWGAYIEIQPRRSWLSEKEERHFIFRMRPLMASKTALDF